GELKYILVTASPDDDLMVRFVLRSRRYLERLCAAVPDLRRRLPQLAVAAVNIQSVHQAVIEGPEEIVLTEEDRLLMRLSLPSP
ncbi:23S rRNA (uracil(747)-C(5))-methyltransferase, partial [Escherichia coli]|nr:23S rRNA (uracil(747)-C(5))-methyltransferase [Escherichia coli]